MKNTTIGDLLKPLAGCESVADTPVSGVAYRSDEVRPGDAFFCISGFAHDGHSFAADAANHGAAVVVGEREVDVPVPQIVVDDSRVALAHAAASFYGHPSATMNVVGITGTNGKTTTAYLIDSILRAAGHTTGLVGTVETRIAGERQHSQRTTPESADLQRLLASMR